MQFDTSMIVSHQWASRPDDERFTSLTALGAYVDFRRRNSKQVALPNRQLTVLPSSSDRKDIAVTGPNGHPVQFTHWSFGQMCTLAGAPASYMRSGLPGVLVADNLNWGLHHTRQVEDLGVLLRRRITNGDDGSRDVDVELAAATGPRYGRIWDAEVVGEVINEYGNGVDGPYKVPGEFGKQVPITKDNTTIYGSDRDIWFFLADEENRVTVPNRRDGQTGTLARGFYVTNSEVGSGVLGFGMFLFDYLCCNRIMWGLQEKHEIRIRHTVGAPFRWDEEVRPVLKELARTDISARPIEEMLKAAQAQKIEKDIDEFLKGRFGLSAPIIAAHMAEEGRPIETLFDVVTAATAYAKLIPHQDARVLVERQAGALLKLAA